MPKYLAQDFLAEALQHRRSQLERMLIAPPHHIEFVDAYVHKGEVEDSLYTSPWLLEDFDADPVTHLPGGLYNELSLEEGVRRDLDRLVAETASLRVGVESYQEGSSSADNISDVGSDIDLLLSQDINSAIEKFASSSDASGPLGGCMREEFPPENIHPWDVNITTECGQHLLEEPESPSHLALLSSTVPLAKDLAQRVKLMMVQDPLTDSSGQLYTYTSVFKSDFILDVDSPERPTGISAPPFEEFDHEAATIGNDEIDPVLELCVSSPSPPLSSEATGLLPLLPSPISSPEKELMDEEPMNKQSNKDLKSLVQELNLSHLTVMELPNFSPSAREKPGMVDFTKLNDADVSHDSDDSGIGHALLESPCLPSTSSPLTTTPIPKQLSTLDPLPLSPNDQLVLMNPSCERKFLKRIWDKDKVFDSVLALILPYPDIEETVEAQVVGSNVLEEARRLLNLRALKLDGDLELGLPWDPLAVSYREMALAQRSLTQPWCAGDKEGRRGKEESGNATPWREEFNADDLVKAFEEEYDDVLPTGILQRGRAGDHHPNLRAGHCPTTHPLDSLQPPSSRTFGQPSSNGDRSTVRSSLPEGGGTKTSCFAARSHATTARNNNSGASALDTFMMLRSVRVSAGGKKRAPEEDSTEYCPLDTGPRDTPQEKGDLTETGITSPVFSNVCLSGEYQSAVSKIEKFAAQVVRALIPFGLNVPQSGARIGGLSLDAMKFFLKQQQKALEDNQGLEKAVELLRSCRLAACLYVLGSLAETLVHCSLTAGLGRFSSLYEKYENLIGAGLDVVKQELLQLQLASREGGLAHPKLHQLIRIVSGWTKEGRRNRREKAVVVVDREFPPLSGEILDFLQSLPGLKSCVFSFGTDGSLNPLYLEAVEERFHHYDCLVVPMDSIADTFPWEKISLLVEYEPLSTPLFPEGSLPNSARLKQYVILRTVREPSAASLADSGLQEGGLSSVQYTFIASENITANTQLLQLLETRYNMLIIERDYSELRRESRKTNRVSYADLIVDQSSGIVLRPLSLLSNDVGLRTLVNLATALSLQYEKCWIILFAQADNSYPFGGCVPTNLARLHASLAHYCPKRDHYDVKVLCVPSTEEAAQMIRRVSEETHKNCKVWSYKDWIDRSWLEEDLSKAERFLLNFPCLNAFSAQLMLKKCPLGQLLSMELPQLQTTVPWLPEKALKFFSTMCHVTLGRGAPFTASTSEWNNVQDKYCSVDFQNMQDSETFDNHFPPNDSAPLQIEAGQDAGQDAGLGYMMPGAGYTEAPVISGTESDVVVMSSGDERELLTGEHGEFSIMFGETAAISGPSVLEYKNGWDGPLYGSNYDQASSHFSPNPPSSPAPLDFSLLGGNDERSFDPSFTSSSFQLSPTHDQTKSLSNLLDFPQSNSPPSYASTYSWNQSGEADNPNIASFNQYQPPPPPTAVKLPVFSASSRTGKTPSQKEIKNAVMSKLSSSFHPSDENTTRLAKEYYSGLVSSRFLASAAARHTNTPSRNPVKSLDLGFEDLCDRVQNPQFQSNDRSIAVTGSTNGRALSNSNDVGLKSRSVSNWRNGDSLMSDRPQRLLDLKAFHSREMQQVAQGSGWNVGGNMSTHPSRHVDNWLNLPCVISSKATRQKRPCSEVSLSDSWVPSDSVSPEGVETSFFGSPTAGSVPLSPTRSKKRRLVCEKIPGSADGQTRLTFS